MVDLRDAVSSVLVVMGVSGSGKSTVGKLLAEELGWPFEEGDDLHPPANVAKMRAGIALDDADRAPWLAKVAAWVDARLAAHANGVISCSALRRTYREQIARPGVTFVYLHADRATLQTHLAARHHAFMPPSLLDSQLKALEEPATDEPAIRVEVAGTPQATVAAVLARVRSGSESPML